MASKRDIENRNRKQREAARRKALREQANAKQLPLFEAKSTAGQQGASNVRDRDRKIFEAGYKHATRQARQVVGQQAGKQGLKEVEVDVKASSRAPEHKEHRWVRSEHQRHVEGLTDAERTEAHPGGEHPALKSSGEENYVPAEDPKIPSYLGQFHPLTSYPADQLSEIAAGYAQEILNSDPDTISPQPVKEKRAIEKAITDIRSVAAKQAPKKGKSKGTINITQLTPSRVRKAGFEPTISQASKQEAEVYFGKSETERKTNVGKKQSEIAAAVAKRAPTVNVKDLRSTGTQNAPKSGQVYTQQGPPKKRLTPGKAVTKSKISAQQFLRNMPQEEKDWVNQQMTDPKGLFFGAKNNQVPGAYRRWQRYVSARQEGYEDRDNITEWLKADNRGRKSTNDQRRHKAATDKMIQDRYTKGVVNSEGRKQRDRYKSLAPSHEDFGVGIRAPGIPSDSELKEMYPDAGAKEIFEIKQSAVQSANDQFMKNTREAHEQRQHQVLQQQGKRTTLDTGAENGDRVVFFTTSVGHPAVSVSANSLVGQYIIKKRKKMLVDTRQNTRAQVRGEFPYAVRDQHLVEVATGLSFGAQGRWGAFRHAGYRAGSKTSKGYGKMLPVGSQIMRNSEGQAMYDRNGNLRYTDGMTRPFDARTSREVGLRVYLG